MDSIPLDTWVVHTLRGLFFSFLTTSHLGCAWTNPISWWHCWFQENIHQERIFMYSCNHWFMIWRSSRMVYQQKMFCRIKSSTWVRQFCGPFMIIRHMELPDIRAQRVIMHVRLATKILAIWNWKIKLNILAIVDSLMMEIPSETRQKLLITRESLINDHWSSWEKKSLCT